MSTRGQADACIPHPAHGRTVPSPTKPPNPPKQPAESTTSLFPPDHIVQRFAGSPANIFFRLLLYPFQAENQADNAGNPEIMFFFCTCIFARQKPLLRSILQLAKAKVAKPGQEWKMWSIKNAREDKTSCGTVNHPPQTTGKVKSSESNDSELKHLRGDSNPCFSLERAAS